MRKSSPSTGAWAELAARYLDLVYRLAYARTGSRADAEDVTQEVMLKLLSHAGKIESEAHLKAWLIRVTVNESANLFRSAWRRFCAPLEPDAPEAREAPPRDDRLEAALSALSPKLRVAVHLFYYEAMTTEEIARTLGIRPAAARERLHRAREILRREMTKEGGSDCV